MKPVYYKRYDINVSGANTTVSAEFEIDKDVPVITGFLLTSDQEDQLYYRGSQQLLINGIEILPENYESKLLMSGLGVNPDRRYYTPGRIEVLNGKIRIVYKDTDNVNASFNPYRVSVYVRGVKKPQL